MWLYTMLDESEKASTATPLDVTILDVGNRNKIMKNLKSLGLCYEKGFGTKKDIDKAIEQYQRAVFE